MHLYKYLSRSTGEIVLTNQTLRWSTPGTLNDPYDMQYDLHIKIDREAVITVTLDKLWESFYGNACIAAQNKLGALISLVKERFPQMTRNEFNTEFGIALRQGIENGIKSLPVMQQETRDLLENCKILCLSSSPEVITMWTHYADSHQVIVLIFRSIAELDSPWTEARPINYVNDMPRLFDDEFLSDMLSGRIAFDPKTIMDRLIYTKSTDWESEREWRICVGAGRNPNAQFEDLPFHRLELDAVILGCRMSANDQKFAALANQHYPHAAVMKAKKSSTAFEIHLQDNV